MTLALTPEEQQTIRDVLVREFGPDIRIWVFGSRSRGSADGDIDLYAEVPDRSQRLLMSRLKARRVLEALLQEKIDLIVRHATGEKTAFDEMARETGVPLRQ